jgi:hypothetical protein
MVQEVLRVLLAHRVGRVLQVQVKVHKETEVLQEQQVRKDLKVPQVIQALMVQGVLRVLQVRKVGRVLQVQLLVHKVIEEHKALKVHRVGKEYKVTEELMV